MEGVRTMSGNSWARAWSKWWRLALTALTLVAALPGCSRDREAPPDVIAKARLPLSAIATRTYGFESLLDWSAVAPAPALTPSTIRVEGAQSVAVEWRRFLGVSQPRPWQGANPAPSVVGFDLRSPRSQSQLVRHSGALHQRSQPEHPQPSARSEGPDPVDAASMEARRIQCPADIRTRSVELYGHGASRRIEPSLQRAGPVPLRPLHFGPCAPAKRQQTVHHPTV